MTKLLADQLILIYIYIYIQHTHIHTHTHTHTQTLPLRHVHTHTYTHTHAHTLRYTCCGPGGAWSGKCGAVGDADFEHTWTEGVKACKGVGQEGRMQTLVPEKTAVTVQNKQRRNDARQQQQEPELALTDNVSKDKASIFLITILLISLM